MSTTEATAAADKALRFPLDALAAAKALGPRGLTRQEIAVDDAHLNCEICLPPTWRRQDPPEDRRDGTQTMAAWADPAVSGAVLRIAVLKLFREINPADVVRILIHRAGGLVVHERRVSGAVGELPDTLSTEARPGTDVIARRTATKDGDRCVIVEAVAPSETYNGLADTVLAIMASFKLTNPEGRLTAEPLRTLAIPRARFRAAIPTSWRVDTREPATLGRPRIVLRDAAAPSDVEVVLAATDLAMGRDVPALLLERLQELAARGLRGNGMTPKPWCGNTRVQLAWLTGGSVELDGRTQDFRLAVLEHPRASVLVNMIGPVLEENPPDWAINKRLFELLCLTADVCW